MKIAKPKEKKMHKQHSPSPSHCGHEGESSTTNIFYSVSDRNAPNWKKQYPM